MLDILAAAILLVFVAAGAWRGTLRAGSSLAVLALSYAAGLVAATRFGPSFSQATGLSPWLGAPLAGSLAFVGAFVLLGLGARALVRREQEWRGEEPRSGLDRLGGACFGALRGGLVVILVGWLGLWLDAARTLRDPAHPAGSLAGSAVGRVAETVVEKGAAAALDDSGGGGLAARLLARPGPTLGRLQTLLDEPRVQRLGRDRTFWTYVEHGAVDAALNRASFYQILHDARLRQELAEVGLISQAAAVEPATFRHEAKEVLSDLGPRLRRVRQSPELEDLSRDPEVASAVQQGNVLALLRHPSFQRVVSQALTDAPEPG